VTAANAAEKALRANSSKATPLGQLKSRSALERWNNVSSRWRKTRTRTSLGTVVEASSEEVVPARLDDKPGRFRPIIQPRVDPLAVGLQDEPKKKQSDAAPEEIKAPEFRKISEIQPYFDYAPPSDLLNDAGPNAYLCPRTDGKKSPACPKEFPLSEATYQPRMLPESVFSWEASNLFHNPLYFEDPALERYGHTLHPMIQPFASTARFGVQFLGLPYSATIDPFYKRRYALGWYRPGECAPHKHYQIPLNADAAAYTAGVYTGLFFIFP
jgi:hypothetical protein